MEVLYGAIITGSIAYLITELNSIQKELKSLRESVIYIQIELKEMEFNDRS